MGKGKSYTTGMERLPWIFLFNPLIFQVKKLNLNTVYDPAAVSERISIPTRRGAQASRALPSLLRQRWGHRWQWGHRGPGAARLQCELSAGSYVPLVCSPITGPAVWTFHTHGCNTPLHGWQLQSHGANTRVCSQRFVTRPYWVMAPTWTVQPHGNHGLLWLSRDVNQPS